MASNSLASHSLDNYSRLRRGMAVIAFLLPLVLLLGGKWIYAVPTQTSISAYYYANENLRDILVGVLFAVGTFLYLYKGEWWENLLLDIAGVCAVGIAIFETAKGGDCSPDTHGVTAHGIFAVLFFTAISVVCISVAVQKEDVKRTRRLGLRTYSYVSCAFVMLVTMIVGLVYSFFLPAPAKLALCNANVIFWLEAFGIWAFSTFWFLRTLELDARVSWRPWRNDLEI